MMAGGGAGAVGFPGLPIDECSSPKGKIFTAISADWWSQNTSLMFGKHLISLIYHT